MKKKIPTGIVEFERLHTENYYSVDKTLMIQEFLERASVVTLITRPRRFGKTLNMSMMAEFFDNTKDSQRIFQDTNISKTEYYNEMNQYPVIFLSFASAKDSISKITKVIKQQIANAYQKYESVFEIMGTFEKASFDSIVKNLNTLDNGSLEGVEDALIFLMKKIEQVKHKKTMVFIDEYDTPFIEAHVQGYYQEIKGGLSSLLHITLKDNPYLQYAMLTGIQHVANDNILSGLNNLVAYTVKDKEYAKYFGFTTEETKTLLEYYDLTLSDEVEAMYNGYNMGGIDICNPWSIINYASSRKLQAFWVNTSSNTMIKQFMKHSKESFKEQFETLIKRGYLDTQVVMDTSFYEDNCTSGLWGLFVNAGYLTIDRVNDIEDDEYRLRIPNQEVARVFTSLTAAHLSISENALATIFYYLRTMNSKAFFEGYKAIILHLPSYHELKDEASYHMMMLGLCAWLSGEYQVSSNRESGKGRCDTIPLRYIILKAKKKELPSFVLEFRYCAPSVKYTKEKEQLEELAKQATKQIEEKQYDSELEGEIIHIGLAHCGKEVAMFWEQKTK